MNILQYNVLDGCREQDRFERLNGWMSRQSYDVIGFNELNEWTNEPFQLQASNWGCPHSVLFEMKESNYRIGIISRHPIETIELTETDFAHGLLHVRIRGVHYFVTHLTPGSSIGREQEAQMIADRVRFIEDPVIVMGDLNTLSPIDRDEYEQGGVPELFVSNDKLANKFMVDGGINYRPMQILLDAGLMDAAADQPFQQTVPTPFNNDSAHAAKLRIDYVLVNEAMKRRNPVATAVHDEEVNSLSDHFPIRCQWTE